MDVQEVLTKILERMDKLNENLNQMIVENKAVEMADGVLADSLEAKKVPIVIYNSAGKQIIGTAQVYFDESSNIAMIGEIVDPYIFDRIRDLAQIDLKPRYHGYTQE